MSRQQIIDGVKAYALAHYEDGGWDVIVECWEDSDIDAAIGRCRTVAGAVKRLKSVEVSVYAERQADARISAF